MPPDLSPMIAATARWLIRAYPAPGGVVSEVLAEVQARQAATVAAWLRYPTEVDAALLDLAGPGGSIVLDHIVGTDPVDLGHADNAWRSWVDEVVASWACCLLTDSRLAFLAVATLAGSEQMAGLPFEFRRLTAPDEHDRTAAALLRHPDLVTAVADLHRHRLLDRLHPGSAGAA